MCDIDTFLIRRLVTVKYAVIKGHKILVLIGILVCTLNLESKLLFHSKSCDEISTGFKILFFQTVGV